MYRYRDARDVGRDTARGRLAPGGLGCDRFAALSDPPIRRYGKMTQTLAPPRPECKLHERGGVTLTR
jgi:hypothetical protein